MEDKTPVIEIQGLSRKLGSQQVLDNLSFTVMPGQCHGFFGRNGAGKTTTMRCMLDILHPDSGSLRLFGMDPRKEGVAIKKRLSYVPDNLELYPWMTVREGLDYLASFREHWNRDLEQHLLSQFTLKEATKVKGLSKGQKMQLALVGAVSPEPELLLLDEPTAGLDPVVRREFIETVIGAYQDTDPENRTLLISTHLLTEFEGLVDHFTIIDQGKTALSLETDQAKKRFARIRASFGQKPTELKENTIVRQEIKGHDLVLVIDDDFETIERQLQEQSPLSVEKEALDLEEIFVSLV